MTANGTITPTSWTDPVLTVETTHIRAAHIIQLRTAIQNLQNLAPNVTNCGYTICQTCQSLPCQTCQSIPCQTCQSVPCQTCQSSSCQSDTCQSNTCQSDTCQTCQSDQVLCQACNTGNCSQCTWQCSNCSGGGSCFIAGTFILMADLSWKPIEAVGIGEKVIGLNGVNNVIGLLETKLGTKRSIWRLPKNNLIFSGEHPFWIKNPQGVETWGTHDYTQYLREQKYHVYEVDGKSVKYGGLTKSQIYIITETVEYAHLEGFVKQDAFMLRNYDEETKLYNLVVGGSHSFIANGYVVSGELHDDDFDYDKVRWVV